MVCLSDLSAISQRDYTQYYQHILKQEEQICHAIQEFFSQHIQYNFLDEDCEHKRRLFSDRNPLHSFCCFQLLKTWNI